MRCGKTKCKKPKNLKGKATWQRAKLLISLAHPDFRAELEEAARRINVITRGTAGLRGD